MQCGRIPAAQFELCIRSVGINAPRAVYNVLLEMVGVDPEGNVDYVKFLEVCVARAHDATHDADVCGMSCRTLRSRKYWVWSRLFSGGTS